MSGLSGLSGLSSIFASGNTSPPPPDPADTSLWLKLDGTLWQDSARTTPVVNYTDPVGSWDDFSPNDRHAKQATSNQRPTYTRNGIYCVSLGAINQLTCDTFNLGNNTTWFFVFRGFDLATPIQGLFDSAPNQANVFRNYEGTAGNLNISWWTFAYNLTIGNTDLHLLTITTNDSPQRTLNIRLDGVFIDDATDSGTVLQWGTPTFGSVNLGGAANFNGSFQEIIIYDSILDDAAILDVEAYLTYKYFTGPQTQANDPVGIPGCGLWLMADGTLWQNAARTIPAVANADPVGAWDDESGNRRWAKQITDGSRPVISSDGIEFSSDFLTCDTFALGTETTWFFVFKPSATTITGLFDTGPNVNNIVRNYGSAGGNLNIEWVNANVQVPIPDTNTHILTFTTTSDPQRTVVARLDGVEIGSNTEAAKALTWYQPTFGTINLGGAGFYSGTIKEILIYDSVLDESNILLVEDYLGRWL